MCFLLENGHDPGRTYSRPTGEKVLNTAMPELYTGRSGRVSSTLTWVSAI